MPLRELPGLRLKFRDSPDGVWITATVWIEDRPIQEIARIGRGSIDDAGGTVYQEWVDVISTVFDAIIHQATGIKPDKILRRRADYTGEKT